MLTHFEGSPDLDLTPELTPDLTPELTPELVIREVPTILKMIPFRISRSVNNFEKDPISSCLGMLYWDNWRHFLEEFCIFWQDFLLLGVADLPRLESEYTLPRNGIKFQ